MKNNKFVVFKDKNGKNIYENDEIKAIVWETKREIIGLIKYEMGTGAFMLRDGYTLYSRLHLTDIEKVSHRK